MKHKPSAEVWEKQFYPKKIPILPAKRLFERFPLPDLWQVPSPL